MKDRKINVISYQRTCLACPSQWEGVASDGQVIYIRYRHGTLTWGVGKDIDSAVDDSFNCFGLDFEDDFSGYMTDDEMKVIMFGQDFRFQESGESN